MVRLLAFYHSSRRDGGARRGTRCLLLQDGRGEEKGSHCNKREEEEEWSGCRDRKEQEG